MLAQRNRDRQEADNWYLITWVCYGSWLPGRLGTVHRTLNRFGGPLPEPDPRWERQSLEHLVQEPYVLDSVRRGIVLASLIEVCPFRGWTLFAAHVRSNHVHVVLAANCKPERVMTALKAYSSRALNSLGLDPIDRRRWARHGSTEYLWDRVSVEAAVEYVVREQGAPMAVFELSNVGSASD